ncbi:MAG: DUF169 domain-containing protein [Thermodesulfobacteriota bacterium]
MARIDDLLALASKDKFSYSEISDIIERLIKLDFPPVAVKFFFDQEEMGKYQPDRIPVHPITFCAFIAASRSSGYILVSGEEKLQCASAKYVFGWRPYDDKQAISHIKYATGRQQAEKFIKTKPRLPEGKLKGFLTAPLEKTPVAPDVVHFICTPLQAYHILNDYMAAMDAHPLTFTQTISSAVCGSDVLVYQTQRPNMSTMCSGSHTSGKTERGELNVAIPGTQIEAVAKRMLQRTVRDRGASFPHRGDSYPGLAVCISCPLLIFKKPGEEK